MERLLKRDRAVTIFALALLFLLAWLYLAAGAGMAMGAWEMTRLALAPAAGGHHEMGAPAWGLGTFALYAAMWWVMMIAMMVPAAAPTVLLYATVHRNAEAQGRLEGGSAPVGAFLAGYLSIWLLFSLAATALQWALERGGLVSAMTMSASSRWVAGGLLIAAGIYQLSPLKQACLSHCRAPAAFISRHWRPGRSGALRLGMRHGAYCVGCCWLLMAMLFVGGVMNIVWIAALTLMVMAEKLLSRGPWVARGAGLVLVLWGVATMWR